MQYSRNEIDFKRGTFRAKGDILEIYPSSTSESALRVEFWGDEIEKISEINPLTGKSIGTRMHVLIPPASQYVTNKAKMERAIVTIEEELDERIQYFKDNNKLIEAQRIEERTNFDIEMMKETGFCQGIENYSRHMSGRAAGSPPYTLFDYFPKDFLLLIDESHATIPQVRAMYNGDRARKDSLVKYGFRLPSAYDNRPLNFDEFEENINQGGICQCYTSRLRKRTFWRKCSRTNHKTNRITRSKDWSKTSNKSNRWFIRTNKNKSGKKRKSFSNNIN